MCIAMQCTMDWWLGRRSTVGVPLPGLSAPLPALKWEPSTASRSIVFVYPMISSLFSPLECGVFPPLSFVFVASVSTEYQKKTGQESDALLKEKQIQSGGKAPHSKGKTKEKRRESAALQKGQRHANTTPDS